VLAIIQVSKLKPCKHSSPHPPHVTCIAHTKQESFSSLHLKLWEKERVRKRGEEKKEEEKGK
jgi:hypothetical protein